MKRFITLLLTFLPFCVFSQNLTGTWEGGGGDVTYIKMVIKHKGDSIYGYTYDEGGGHCLASFAAKYLPSRKNLVGRGTRIIKNSGSHVLASYDLVYSKEGNVEFLRQRPASMNFLERLLEETPLYLRKVSNKTEMPGPRSKPVVKRVPKPATTIPPAKPKPAPTVVVKTPVKPPVKKTDSSIVARPVPPVVKPTVTAPPVVQAPPVFKPAPAAVLKRKEDRVSKLVEKIYTPADTIRMQVYDNGEVDGDTVTVFFDNRVILDRYRISDKAKEILLPISRTGEHQIELFANNLGNIPPNTALIIITAGGKRYELRASYDLQTNAKIVIQYRE